MWQTSCTNCFHLFINYDNSNSLYEIVDDKIKFTFILFAKPLKNNLILYDESRRIFIKISNDKLFWGFTSENINIELFKGEWIVYQKS